MSSRDEASRPHPPESAASASREKFESMLAAGKRFGLKFELSERFLDFWKYIGFRKAAVVFIAVTIPIIKYEWLPRAASSSIEGLASSYGVDLKVAEWGGDVWDLKATAHDVEIETHGRYTQGALLSADKVIVDFSVWRKIRTGNWIQSIEVEGPKLYLEHTLAGRWNWEDVIDEDNVEIGGGSPAAPDGVIRVRDTDEKPANPAHAFEIPRFLIKDMRIQWVENLPGQSGGGLIHNSQSVLYIDDVDVIAEDIAGPVDERETPTKFSVDGRTADGRVSLKGRINLFNWAQPIRFEPPAAPAPFSPTQDGEGSVWSPRAGMKVYLENVGTAALAQMVPNPTLMATSGTMSGLIDVAVRDHKVDCRSDLTLKNVAYAANPYSSMLPRAKTNDVTLALADFRVNERLSVGCDGDLRNAEYRPFYTLQVALTREAVRTAPPAVRQAAAADYTRLSGQTVVDQTMQGVTDELAKKAGAEFSKVLGPEAGNALAQSLTGSQGKQPAQAAGQNQNPANQAAKGLSGVFKKLFGSNKKKKSPH